MALPFRTAYYSSSHSVSSLSDSSLYSDATDPPRSTAPTTPLFRIKTEDSTSGNTSSERDSLPSLCSWSNHHCDSDETSAQLDDDAVSVASATTYASTAPSVRRREREPVEEYSAISLSRCQTHGKEGCTSKRPPLASSPSDFPRYFPSTRLLRITHPCDGVDSHVNLIVQTEGWASTPADVHGEASTATSSAPAPVPVPLTLFHLRMHNLKDRQFSLRRYSRQSGREVCHTTRRLIRSAHADSAEQTVPRRITSLLTMMQPLTSLRRRRGTASGPNVTRPLHYIRRPRTEPISVNTQANHEEILLEESVAEKDHLKARDISEEPQDLPDNRDAAKTASKTMKIPLPVNTTKLQFSNYMHLNLHRRGGRGRGPKRYDFEHWGVKYSWYRRMAQRTNGRADDLDLSDSYEFHLYARSTDTLTQIAHVVPERPQSDRGESEACCGGWVPPSSLWISDSKTISGHNGAEIADVIVSTGLIALVDDTAKRKWERKSQLLDRMTLGFPSRKR